MADGKKKEPKPPASISSGSLRAYVTLGVATCVLLIGVMGGWAATAKLASAIIAGGQVVVASNVKHVQHPDGGIVGAIDVKDGDKVVAGQELVRLDETLVAANRALIDGEIIANEARLARLVAERDDATALEVPDELVKRQNDPLVKDALEAEKRMFGARRETMKGQVNRLEERRHQLEQQIDGLNAQREAKEGEISLIDEELEVLGGLYDRGRTTRDKIVNLKRNRMRLEGERGDLVSQVAIAKGRIAETELEILQLTTDQREKTFGEISEIRPEIANLKERRAAADFQLRQMNITAPVDGTVFELMVHTVGGVIKPGETILSIVPEADVLVVEAKLAPTDVDQVHVGQDAQVALHAFDARTTPQLKGKVAFVAAEASEDQRTGLTYYQVRVTLNEGELSRLPDDLALLPGMPAEVFIATGSQTVANYLIRPLVNQIRRAWREQ